MDHTDWGTGGVGADPDNHSDAIPQRYIDGCLGDEKLARERWQATKVWRKAYGADEILEEPQEHFGLLKRMYPHFVHKKSKDGHLVYFEQPGKCDVNKLWKSGVTLDDIARHYIFTSEYMWRVLDPREEAQQLSVFDLKGARLSDLYGNALKLFRKCSELIQLHYPERSNCIVVINAPFWFQAAYSMVSPFIDPRTKKKIQICGSSYKKVLLTYVDADHLPRQYGGLSEVPSEFESSMWEHVKKVHESHNLPPPELASVHERAHSAPPKRDKDEVAATATESPEVAVADKASVPRGMHVSESNESLREEEE